MSGQSALHKEKHTHITQVKCLCFCLRNTQTCESYFTNTNAKTHRQNCIEKNTHTHHPGKMLLLCKLWNTQTKADWIKGNTNLPGPRSIILLYKCKHKQTKAHCKGKTRTDYIPFLCITCYCWYFLTNSWLNKDMHEQQACRALDCFWVQLELSDAHKSCKVLDDLKECAA